MRAYLLLLLFFPHTLFAHALYVVAQQQGSQIRGETYYSDMTPAAEHYIGIFNPNDLENPILEGMSDKQGRISLLVPDENQYVLVVEGVEGHKATLNVPHIPSNNAQTMQSNDEFVQLRKDIAQLEQKIYWRDILGGIGYIFGLVGITLWFRQRKQ